MERVNFNKQVKMHNICDRRVIDRYLDCICFKGGWAYASNGSLLVKNRIDEICNFDLPEQALLEGKALPPDSYKKILEYEKAVISEGGITCVDEKKGKSFFEFYEPKQIEGLEKKEMPDFDSVFRGEKSKILSSADRICLNFKYLCKVEDSLYSEGNGFYISYYENAAVISPANDFCSGRAVLMQIKGL
jgi:hypothetical protein